jgi:hypothetical protein
MSAPIASLLGSPTVTAAPRMCTDPLVPPSLHPKRPDESRLDVAIKTSGAQVSPACTCRLTRSTALALPTYPLCLILAFLDTFYTGVPGSLVGNRCRRPVKGPPSCVHATCSLSSPRSPWTLQYCRPRGCWRSRTCRDSSSSTSAGCRSASCPGTQVLRLAVPAYCQDDPALAQVVDEEHADRFLAALDGRTVRDAR